LLVFIDDATSKLMQLRFVPSESTDSYFEALNGYLTTHGCPTAFYSDKHTVFRVNKPDAKGGSGMTQFGRALAELNIEIPCANSSQAKGRVERAKRTLQDRLVKELRLAGICDMSAGNAFLTAFVERFNEKFSVPAAKPENMHRRLNVQASRLTDILCHREQRHLSQQLSLSYDRKQIILERGELADKLASMLRSMSFEISHWKCGGRDTHFPIAYSARTNASVIPRSSRTSGWAMRFEWSRPSRTLSACRPS
jgi:hypothetical protein